MKSQFIARKLLKSVNDPNKEKEFPSLRNMAISTIAANFPIYQSMETVTSPQILEEIYSKIRIQETSIILLAKSIDKEEFWKRACGDLFSLLDSNFLNNGHGSINLVSSKQVFFEMYFRRIVHDSNISTVFLLQVARVAGSLVKCWLVEEVSEKLENNVFSALEHMDNLTDLSVSFACPLQEVNFGIDSYRGINLERAELIQKHQKFENLECLRLENNLINDKVLKVLLKCVKNSRKLKKLSLAHNNLGDAGVQVLCHFLTKHSEIPLAELDLSDNEIGYEGGRLLAQFLQEPTCQIQILSLKINFLNNCVLFSMFEKISANKTSKLRKLNLSTNLFRDNIVEELTAFLGKNSGLEELCLDANEIEIPGASAVGLHTVIFGNVCLKKFSMKFNRMDAETSLLCQKINTRVV